MGLHAPALLLGLLAAVVPYLVHRVGKRPPRPLPFAAMQLLLEAQRRVRARQRLRELLLLLARTLAAAAIPLIFARPFALRPAAAPEISAGVQAAVLVLDDSASMQARVGRATAWERARQRARQIAGQLAPESTLALVLASAGGNAPVGELTVERGRVLDALDRAQPSTRTADFADAVARAQAILASAEHRERRIYVLTDLQEFGWQSVPTGPPAPDAPAIVLLDVRPDGGGPPGNRAVVALDAVPDPGLGPGGVLISAELAAWGLPRAQVALTLLVDGQPVTKGLVDLAPGGRARKTFSHALPREGPGLHDVTVELEPDEFPLDDRRYLRLALGQTPRVLLINGDPRTEKTDDELFFVESALRNAGGGSVVESALADDVDAALIDRAGIVVVANLAVPSPELARLLERHVGAGRGLLLALGARVDPDAWNANLGTLLPQPLGLLRTAAALPGQTQGELLDQRPAERLAPLDRDHPLLSAFADAEEGLASARFFKYYLLAPTPDDGLRTTILRYETGAPALVERVFPAGPGGAGRADGEPGRVILLTTTLDREWTDLPIRPGFLPLCAQLVRRLGGAPATGAGRTLLAGQPHSLALRARHLRVEVERPDGSVWVARRTPGAGPPAVSFSGTSQLGFYRVRAAGADNALAPLPEQDFAVNLDPRESDPTRLAPDHPLRRARDAQGAEPSPPHREPLWHALGFLLVLALLAESLLSLTRSRRPPGSHPPGRDAPADPAATPAAPLAAAARRGSSP